MRGLRVPALAMCAAAALAVGLTGQALAEPVSGSPARSCVVTLPPEDGRDAPSAPRCYDSLAEAVSAVTGDAVHIPPHSNTLTQDQLDAGKRDASTKRGTKSRRIIGIEYEHSGYRGTSKVYNVNAGSCRSGGTYRDGDLSDDPLNDEISSARSYEGCTSTHYQHSGFSGMEHDCRCSSMEAMNDRTSSIRWS